MNDWYYNSDWAAEEKPPETVEEKRKRCWHVWKKVLLLSQTVEDCELCGIHKEKWEKGIYDNGEKSKGLL